MAEAANVLDTLRGHATHIGDHVAYWSPFSEWTFARLHRASNRLAQGMAADGIGPGDRVACLSKHTAETVVVWMAAAKLGAVCMPVNWRLAPPEIAYVLDDGRAKFLMADAEFADAVAALPNPPARIIASVADAPFGPSLAHWSQGFDDRDPGRTPALGDTALQLYSSGTTGHPKGVELSFANLAANHAVLTHTLGFYGPPSIMLNALPAFHIAGIGVALFTGGLGAKLVLSPDFVPNQVLDMLVEQHITHTFLVPAMIQFLLEVPDVAGRDYSRLQGISYGASPISQRVLVNGMKIFGCGFTQVYGLTEVTGAVTQLFPDDHQTEGDKAQLLRSAGSAMQGVELKIVDPDTGNDLPDGQVGEVWIRTEQNMIGYWNRPEATAEALVPTPDGPPWFRSGDAGYLQDGYLFIHDRIKDMIISGGENIYPAEVENLLMQHPGVADGAIFGVPDERWGEAVHAAVVPRDPATFDGQKLIAWMRERLAHFKCPKGVDVMEAIPRNPSGKILKRVLRAPYWEGRGRQVS
ncbi:MAG: long-chain-fatty-acid--CoA ligase [Burkholderiaceae bacterium]